MKGTLQQISAERVAATQNGATGTDFVSHPLPITPPPPIRPPPPPPFHPRPWQRLWVPTASPG